MPLIHIELIEGRTQEQLKNLVADVTDAVTKNTGAPAEHVHVKVEDVFAVFYYRFGFPAVHRQAVRQHRERETRLCA